jgi:hypothetical protein
MFRFGIFLIIIIIYNKEYYHFKYNGIAIYTIQQKKAIKNALFLYVYLNFFFNNE